MAHPLFDSIDAELWNTIDTAHEPFYVIETDLNNSERRLIVAPRTNGVLLGVINKPNVIIDGDPNLHEWMSTPVRIPYEEFYRVYNDIKAMGLIYGRVLDDERRNNCGGESSAVLNTNNARLVLRNGGDYTELGIRHGDDGEENYVTVGRHSYWVTNLKRVINTLSRMIEDYSLTQLAWQIIQSRHPSGIRAVGEIYSRSWPSTNQPETDEEPEGEDGTFLGIIRME